MEKLIGTGQVLERYRICGKTLSQWKKNLAFPYLNFGRHHLYNEGDIAAWEESHKMNLAPQFGRTVAPQRNLKLFVALSKSERTDR